jgi:uncharacterized protein YdhG (YjbR/CyaY superfamily)
MKRRIAKDVDEYITWFPPEVTKRLEKVRRTIHQAVPGAQEKISYAIPTITVDGRYLLYFAAFDQHLSVYPAPRGAADFADELAEYEGGKGTVQFPHDQPVPYDLVRRMARYRLDELKKTSSSKAAKKETRC